jgi:hypothetical protein
MNATSEKESQKAGNMAFWLSGLHEIWLSV